MKVHLRFGKKSPIRKWKKNAYKNWKENPITKVQLQNGHNSKCKM